MLIIPVCMLYMLPYSEQPVLAPLVFLFFAIACGHSLGVVSSLFFGRNGVATFGFFRAPCFLGIGDLVYWFAFVGFRLGFAFAGFGGPRFPFFAPWVTGLFFLAGFVGDWGFGFGAGFFFPPLGVPRDFPVPPVRRLRFEVAKKFFGVLRF